MATGTLMMIGGGVLAVVSLICLVSIFATMGKQRKRMLDKIQDEM